MLEYCKRGHLLSETRRRASDGKTYCSLCRAQSHREWEKRHRQERNRLNKKRRQKRRQAWIELLIARKRCACERCGYTLCFSALDFHHLDEAEKKGQISNLICDKTIGNKEVEDELKKTRTLCKNCHAELHAGLWKWEELDNVQ